MNSTTSVEVQIATRDVPLPGRKLIADCVRGALAFARPDDQSAFEVAVRIVAEDESRALNKQFRQVDRPTNVLAFPSHDADLAVLRNETGTIALGDLVICGPLVLREAADQAKKYNDHWAHLLVHGTLHLLGYDHEDDKGAAEMEALEVRILAARGIDDPYRAR